MSTIEGQVREMIAKFVSGQLEIDDFWDWLSECAWTIEEHDDRTSEAIVYDAMNLMAEFQEGHRTEESVRRELQKHATGLPVTD
jgi:hypothetical protein